MRLAFNINSTFNAEKDLKVQIGILDVAGLEGAGKTADIVLTWERETTKTKWVQTGAEIKFLSPRCYKLFKTIVKRADGMQVTPLAFCRGLVASRSPQTVWDENMKKWRNVATMKDGDDIYELVGINGLAVTATDEESAIKRAKKLITEAMMENPESAQALANFFTQGCKVKKIVSGKAPNAIDIAKLAGPGEEQLAKTPIKMIPKTDKQIEKSDKSEKKVVAKK